MKIKGYIALLTAAVLSVLPGCGESSDDKIKIAYLPITHALALCETAEEYDNVELVKYGSWNELTDALNSGRVDGASAEVIGKGITRLVRQTKAYAPNSKIIVISPIHLGEKVWESDFDPEFSKNSVDVSKNLADVYSRICTEENIGFLDASHYAGPSDIDIEHMNETGHKQFANAVYNKIKEIL